MSEPIFEALRLAGDNPWVKHDYEAHQAAIKRGDLEMAKRIGHDSLHLAYVAKDGLVSAEASHADGLPMPIISDKPGNQRPL